jgi:ABC-2 type transport system ATP-binding protein
MDVPRDAETLRRKIGYMTQKFSLWDDMTVAENLQFIASVFTLDRARARRRISEVTEEFHLEDLSNRLAGSMSGGQRQRLALAAATLHEPELLMLDEPTSAVDPQSRRDFWEKLFELSAAGTTILVSTHLMDEAERCHRLAILDHGALVAEGEPQQLMQAIDALVVEVETRDPQRATGVLRTEPYVKSVAQIGNRLHALLARDISGPEKRVTETLRGAGLAAEVRLVHPNLEDVFVAATSGPGRRGHAHA